ncbi:hypothetical protein [Adhaeribacter terreus]|uniref:Uncharacterized protein n=1 Tax=Adhaeribacter terreus TaxID=529703 RepID=A0ABW0EDM9_9BACT
MGGYNFGRLNFAVFRNPLLQICSFLYVLHTVLRRVVPIENGFLNNYLNDLLCLPLVLGAAVFLQRNMVLRQADYALTGWQIGLVVIYFSLMFEGVIPLFVSRYTADFFDVICYGLGGWAFWFFGNARGSELVRSA